MAEFKLGRLRFVWKDAWQSSVQYYKDDIIRHNGSSYICIIGHVSASNFSDDFEIVTPYWNLLSDGQVWRGEWHPQIYYSVNDIVIYGANLYICQTSHTSADDSSTGLESDFDKWEVYALGLEWKGEWQTNFDYKLNDLVKYGGSTYICASAHISSASAIQGLEIDLANWQIFNQGFDYKGQWNQVFRYKKNDVIKFGGSLFIATTYHTSSISFNNDSANWNKFLDGFQYESKWNYEVTYQEGDIVAYGGNQYLAKRENNNKRPPENTNDWNLFSEGLRFLGDWGEDSSNFEYEIGDLVRLGGFTYRAIQDNTGQQPPNPTYWQEFNTGLNWRGQWLDDQEYYQGDVVRYENNSYVCITYHVSEGDDYSTETTTQPGGGAQNSRPDLDTSGQYWNIIAVGSEESVLNTLGDMVYYSKSGPTRLPIGKKGQILTVDSNNLPSWSYLGATDDVYYVAEHGTDGPYPENGRTIDRPYKSIRFAAEQIEKGVKANSAVRLLELNRRFLQREIVEWTDWQIANAQVGSIWENFSYDSVKCERDMGLLVDAFAYDLAHGGNVRSREAALRYVNSPGSFYVLEQQEQTIASIQYGLSLIEKILKQEEPLINYQIINGDNSTAIVAQYFEENLGDQANAEYESTIGKGGY